ncbi:MAG: hypothetical protein M3296_02685 [Actinomycetota bacterium]|nr:hypothetical protein [Actinomycetota bacterium]
MSTAPQMVFEVQLVFPGEMRWCLSAQGQFESWLHAQAQSGQGTPIERLPALNLELGNPSELQFSWIELPADGAWEAINEAAAIVKEALSLSGLRGARAMRVEATAQNPDMEKSPPLGA